MLKEVLILSIVFTVGLCQNPYPPTEELVQCTEAIWAADTNSFPPEELQYDLTGATLFTNVNEDRFQTGAYPSFRDLLSKFNPQIGQDDPDLSTEIELFLDQVLQTGPMQQAYNCLVNPDWGHVVDEADFRNQLRQYWFLKFSRSDGLADDSSGFEYVFQGQIDQAGSQTTGFHGWVNTYDSEQQGNFVYGGSEANCQDDLVQINDFQFQGASGSVSSIWIGRSPELQLALYSVCFLARRNQNCNFEVTIDGSTKDVTVVTRDIEINGQDTIDFLYPECENDSPPPGSSTTTPPGGGDDLSVCTEAIWGNDTNSFLDSEIEYNLAGPILFTYVDETRFETGIYPLLRDLLTKFNPQIGEPDPPLEDEINAFLDASISTAPMQVALQCLIDFGVVTDEADFRETVRQYWFEKYSRSGGNELDSSGFEHVFQGEIRENGQEMTGWHGWVMTYDTEQSEEFVYGSSQDDCGDGLVQINNYYYRGAEKPISSIWIGKSPELELALYTMCFAVNRNRDCDFTVDGGRPVTVVNYDMSGTNQIGTAYPFCFKTGKHNPPKKELYKCMDAIWRADNNSFTAEELNYNLTSSKLFTNISADRLQTGAYPSFRTLISKFNPWIGQSDPNLTKEIDLFLDQVLETGPVYEAYKCLVDPTWGKVFDELNFKHKLKQYWFTKYSRSSGLANDSSGFEYVFQGQITEDSNNTIGFHSWLNVYDNEQTGSFVYGGSQADCQDGLVQINNFTFHNASGGDTTIWLGRSPELQLAVYTVCFMARRNQNCNFRVQVNGKKIYIKIATKDIKVEGKDTIYMIQPICQQKTRNGPERTTFNKDRLSRCTEAIWSNDTNSYPEEEIKYNLTGEVLFTYVNASRLRTGMYPLFIGLLKKYNQQLGEPDQDMDNETSVFIEAVLTTGPMKVAMQCLIDFGIITNETDFNSLVKQYWFEKYSRSRGDLLDSSGFEHVFMGEIRQNGRELTGWHGWLHLYMMEQQGNITYATARKHCGNGLIQVNNFNYGNITKPISSIWIGKSPELEMSLYTMCFAVNQNRGCEFTVGGGRPVMVVSHRIGWKNHIGTVYPRC